MRNRIIRLWSTLSVVVKTCPGLEFERIGETPALGKAGQPAGLPGNGMRDGFGARWRSDGFTVQTRVAGTCKNELMMMIEMPLFEH